MDTKIITWELGNSNIYDRRAETNGTIWTEENGCFINYIFMDPMYYVSTQWLEKQRKDALKEIVS